MIATGFPALPVIGEDGRALGRVTLARVLALGRIATDRPEIHLLIAGNDGGALSPFRDRMAHLGRR